MLQRILLYTMVLTTLALAAPTSDQSWVVGAYQAGTTAVKLGQLAAAKGSAPQVKAFGAKMSRDYASANRALKQLAVKQGISLAGGSPDAEAAYQHLNGLSGKPFDREYARLMVMGHKKAIASFKQESTEGSDPAIKAFAHKTLPSVLAHAQQAEALQNSVSVFK